MKEKLKKSIALNIILKPVGMILSIIYAPLQLRFLGVESYGIWVTILNIINWISLADIGIGNGLRNSLSKYKVLGDARSSKKVSSTAYICSAVIVSVVLVVGIMISLIINWDELLNTTESVRGAVIVSFIFVCVNLVLSLQKNGFFALHKAEVTSLQTLLVQMLNILGVIILGYFFDSRSNLISMSFLFGFTGLLVNIIFSFILWLKYPYYKPKISCYDHKQFKNLTNIGIKFFVIQIAVIVLFTTDNIIISNLYNPASVTPYNTVYRAFGVINSIFLAFLAPLWNKYAEAIETKKVVWIRSSLKRTKYVWVLFVILIIFITPFFKTISRVWMRQELNYDTYIIPFMAIYYILYSYSGIYSVAFNGMSKVNVQMITAIITAVINIPLSIYFARNCGLGASGVCLGTIICLLITDIVYYIAMKITISKLLKEEA